MNYGLEQIAALATAWLSIVCIAVSVFGSLCALGATCAARRFSRRQGAEAPTTWPDVSILKPLFRAETQLSENIETYFRQDYPGKLQFVFGVQDPERQRDPGRQIADRTISRA